MRRIDRLLIKIQEAQRLDSESLCYALITKACYVEEPEDSPNYNKWAVAAYISKGKEPGSGTMLDTLYFNTRAEAEAAAREIESVHAPTGKRAATQEPIYIICGDEDGAEEINRQAEEGQRELQRLADEAEEAIRGTL